MGRLNAQQQLARLDRLVRRAILGFAGPKKRVPYRPPSADVAVDNDAIGQEVLYVRALDPDRQVKGIMFDVADRHGISVSYVKKILRTMNPDRRRMVETSARALAEVLR